MYGWDTLSIASIERINQAIRLDSQAGGKGLVSDFQYEDDTCQITGRFGPWQILPSQAAPNLVMVDLPIDSGCLTTPADAKLNIGGYIVRVQIPMRMMPSPDNHKLHELRFDFDTQSGIEGPTVKAISVQGEISDLEKQVLGFAVASCLSANAQNISYVFAQVGAAAPAGSEWLNPVDANWCQLAAGDAGYLVLLGVVAGSAADKSTLPTTIDPKLIAMTPGIGFCLDSDLFMRNSVLAHMNANFYKGAHFVSKGKKIVLSKRLALPEQKFSFLYTACPFIDTLEMEIVGSTLVVVAKGQMNLPAWMTMTYSVTNKLNFHFDAATQHVGFAPDKNPAVETYIKWLPVLDEVLGWFVRWIASFFQEHINEPIARISSAMQSVSRPAPAVLAWNGVTDFELTDAALDGCFALIDSR